MIPGITRTQEDIIFRILKDYPFKFYYYGSRARGNFEPVSDLDILIQGKGEIPLNTINQIESRFDTSDLPFVVNLSDYAGMDKDFFKTIQKDLVKVELP